MTQLSEQELAELQIRSLLTRERYYRDTAQWENLRNSYHPDASKTYIKITWCGLLYLQADSLLLISLQV